MDDLECKATLNCALLKLIIKINHFVYFTYFPLVLFFDLGIPTDPLSIIFDLGIPTDSLSIIFDLGTPTDPFSII